MGAQKNLVKIFSLSGERLDKALSIGIISLFVSSIITLGYWAMNRTYDRSFVLIMNPFLLFSTTLVLKLKLRDIREKAKEMAKSNYETLGLSLEEAVNLFQYREELKLIRDWIIMVVLMTLVSSLIAFTFPV